MTTKLRPDIRAHGVTVHDRMGRINSASPIDREPMTRDEYFTAVLAECGNPKGAEYRVGHADRDYSTRVINAMVRLSRYGPPETLGYHDFLRWCYDQKEKP